MNLNSMLSYGRLSENVKMQYTKAKAMKNINEGKVGGSLIEQMIKPNKQKNLEDITVKLKSGKKLSHEELEYLKENAPDLYEKAIKIAREREALEKRLRQCKTKEEVAMVQTQKLKEIATAVQNGEDPEFAMCRVMSANDAYTTFTSSKEFRRLPTQAELEREENKKEKKVRELLKQQEEMQELLNPKDKNELSHKEGILSDTKPDTKSLLDGHEAKKRAEQQQKSSELIKKREWLKSIRLDIERLTPQAIEPTQGQTHETPIPDGVIKAYAQAMPTQIITPQSGVEVTATTPDAKPKNQLKSLA